MFDIFNNYALIRMHISNITYLFLCNSAKGIQSKGNALVKEGWPGVAVTIYAKSHDGCDKLADKSDNSDDNSSQLRNMQQKCTNFCGLWVLDIFDKHVMC